MMSNMFGREKNCRLPGAVAACLLTIALVVGPLCTGLCAGSSCVAPAARSHEGASCHGMSGDSGVRYVANGSACGLADANFAVATRPVFSVKSGPAASAEDTPAVINPSVTNILAIDARAFPASAGPPQEIRTENSRAVVLRI
jgi:hypothetical protein